MFRLPSLRRSGQAVWFSQVLLRCKTPLDIAGILFWWSCLWRLWRDYSVLPHSILNSDPLHVLQVHPLQREAVQMSGVREGLLSVQDSGRPQDVTHAGEGTEAQQDQIIQLHQRAEWLDGRGHWKNKDQRQLQSQYNFFLLSFFISAAGGGAPRRHWEHFLQEETFLSLAQRIAARPALALSA